ncbi:MAG: LuxR C-terminal-related transcriptional regulator [Spirochaetota bacterium]|nr:LuxR C-terminal-related transcriptional regulator [Spirochaetota bacterium]
MAITNQIFIKRYKDLSLLPCGPLLESLKRVAHFKMDNDISQLFPYINAIIEDAEYYEKPIYIRFIFNERLCALYPDNVAISSFENREQAHQFIKRLIDFLNELYSMRSSIKPDYKRKRYIPILDIFRLLPGTNCKECGFLTCIAFAAALSKGEVDHDRCQALSNPITETALYPLFDNDGNLISTIAIDIDTNKRKDMLKKRKEYIESLEGKVLRITEKIRNKNNKAQINLTAREVEVLRLVAEGFTNTEISTLLSISPHTVKSHVLHIFNKTGVNDRTQASVWAIRHEIF